MKSNSRAFLVTCLVVALVVPALLCYNEQVRAPAEVSEGEFSRWQGELEQAGEVGFVRQQAGAVNGCGAELVVASLGPLIGEGESQVREKRIEGPLRSHCETLYELLAKPVPQGEDESLALLSNIMEESHIIDKYRAALAAFNGGHYWVVKKDAVLPPVASVTYIKIFGVDVSGQQGAVVVIPINLNERPEVGRSAEDYERSRRYIIEREVLAFNALSPEVRRLRIEGHDAAGVEMARLYEQAQSAAASGDNERYVQIMDERRQGQARRLPDWLEINRSDLTVRSVYPGSR